MYFIKGKVTRQAHVDIPEGCCEEEYARRGFFGRTSHLYRRQPPVNWNNIEGDLRPHAFELPKLAGLKSGDYLKGRVPFLRNQDVELLFGFAVRDRFLIAIVPVERGPPWVAGQFRNSDPVRRIPWP